MIFIKEIKIQFILITAGLLILLLTPTAYSQSFEDYVKEQQAGSGESEAGYREYKSELESEFEEYKKIFKEELAKYKKELSGYWKKPEFSDDKRWIEYSDNSREKRKVDFQNGQITISLITSETDQNVDKRIRKLLAKLLIEDQYTAFKNDKIAQRVEEKAKKRLKNLKTGKVGNDPILLYAVTGSSDPSIDQIKSKVNELVEKGTISREESIIKGNRIVTLKTKLPPNSLAKLADRYRDLVRKYSGKRKLDDSLVLAIMHTESAFNPMARSYVPAYGLMQIVPKSAGKDATELVYGKPVLLSPSYLYNSENNVKIGTAYIYILYYKYLKKIKNPESRLYCSIAAYNTGAGNVARAFTGTTNINKASGVINSMTPQQVYKRLSKNLKYAEARKYIKTVSKRMGYY